MIMQSKEIDNLIESDVKIEGKTWRDETIRQLWCKNELLFRRLADFWKPSIVVGKQCMNYMHGEIFDAKTRATYEKIQNKICIEPRILKMRMSSAVGQLMRSRRPGKVDSESAGEANEIFAANVILKFFEKEIGEQYLLTKMLFDGCTTGYPQILLFDQAETSYRDPMGGLVAELLKWDSAIMNKIDNPDGTDLTDLMWIARKTKQELIDENPESKDEIKEHFEYIARSPGYGVGAYLNDTTGITIEDARFLDYDVMTGITNYKIDGRLLCIQRLCTQKIKTEVAIQPSPDDEYTLDYQIIPPNWSKKRINTWKRNHPDYKYRQEEVKILWLCRWTSDGLFLKNETHWFQESDNKGNPVFPAGVFVPQIIDNQPTGPGPDDRLLCLMKAIAETEFLHDVRTGSGDLLAYLQGSVVNYDDLPTELSIGNGIAVVDPKAVPGGGIDNAMKILKRTPNESYEGYSDRVDKQLDQTDSISPAVRGQFVSERQSGKAKQSDIAAALIGYSVVAENMNRSIERIKNIECMLIPYVFNREQVLQIYDEDRNENISLTVNETEYDEEGDPSVVANNLSSVKWRWRLTEGDDSPTAKEAELNEMLIFWNTTAPALIAADESLMTLASVLVSMANRTAKKIGGVIAEKAQVKAQMLTQQQMMETMANVEEKRSKAASEMTKAKRAGFSFSITPEDLVQIPDLYKVLVDSQYINPQTNVFQNPAAVTEQRNQNPGGEV